MIPSLDRVALCSKCPVGTSGVVSLITWGGCSRNVSWACYVGSPVVIESWLLLAHSCVISTLSLADCEDQPSTQCTSCCAGVDYTKWNFPQQGLVPTKISLGTSCCEAYWILCCCCLELPTWCIGPGSHWSASGTELCETLPVTAPGQPVLSYQRSTAWGSLCWVWVLVKMTRLCTKACFYQHWARRQVSRSL